MTCSDQRHSDRPSVEVDLRLEPDLTVSEFIEVLKQSTLGERRPISDSKRIAGMLRHADLIATARTNMGQLVGVARAVSDFHYCTYLSDLAVAQPFQRQGIGRRLIEFVQEQAGMQTTLILLSAPAAVGYYPHIGMQQHHSCWIRPAKD